MARRTKRRSRRSRGKRGGNWGAVLGQAAVPASLVVMNNLFGRRTRRRGKGRRGFL
jgi:hypothetical protein